MALLSARQNRFLVSSVVLFLGVAAFGACRQAEGPATESPSATPVAQREAAPAAPSPSPAISPLPIKTGEVPEMMRRAMTREEVEKAFQQLPPQVRDRLKGLSYEPANVPPPNLVRPLPTPTPAKK